MTNKENTRVFVIVPYYYNTEFGYDAHSKPVAAYFTRDEAEKAVAGLEVLLCDDEMEYKIKELNIGVDFTSSIWDNDHDDEGQL